MKRRGQSVSAQLEHVKIGKAIDIHQRLTGMVGTAEFDVGKGACVALGTESDAYRIESALHRLFARWRCVARLPGSPFR